MTEPNPPRAVPGPPRPGPGPAQVPAEPDSAATTAAAGDQPFADLDQRPVADHVTVFEAEHSRLQRELGTIDQL
jgi:hypothetical protein